MDKDIQYDKFNKLCAIMNEFQSDKWTKKQHDISEALKDDVLPFDADSIDQLIYELQTKGNKMIKNNYFVRD